MQKTVNGRAVSVGIPAKGLRSLRVRDSEMAKTERKFAPLLLLLPSLRPYSFITHPIRDYFSAFCAPHCIIGVTIEIEEEGALQRRRRHIDARLHENAFKCCAPEAEISRPFG